MMSQYEQLQITLQYINSVCDQLLANMSFNPLHKLYFRDKTLKQSSQIHDLTHDFSQVDTFHHNQLNKEKASYKIQSNRIQQQINENQTIIQKLQVKITQLKCNKHQKTKNRQTPKKIKEISQLELQLMQQGKLLCCQLKNLNSLQTSLIELKEQMQSYDKRQMQLKLKSSKLIDQQNQYSKYQSMQESYNALLLKKHQIASENTIKYDKKHKQITNKVQAIDRANHELQEMNKCLQQMQNLIKEQIFIISQIQKREFSSNNHKQLETSDEDDSLFERQIQQLRKTIANKKFLRSNRNKSIRFQVFENQSTPKHSIYHYKHQKYKPDSIFKIQILPFMNSDNSQPLDHRNSLPANVKKEETICDRIRETRLQKNFISEKNLANLHTFQVSALQNIINKKQAEVNQLIGEEGLNRIIATKPIQVSLVKNTSKLQKAIPSRQHNHNSISLNSQFIEKMIESSSQENLSKLKNNVRFRTKKSQTQKYIKLQQRSRLNFSKNKKKQQKSISMRSLSLKKEVEPIISKQFSVNSEAQTKNTLNKVKYDQNKSLKTKKYLQRTGQIDQQNEFISNQDCNFIEKNSNKLKYKNKINAISHSKSSINHLYEKINSLKQAKVQSKIQSQQQDLRSSIKEKLSIKEQIKIFKLSNHRKLRNTYSIHRKGKAENIQESDSDNHELPKIEEEKQSIRNTLQSVNHDINRT